MGFLTGFLLGWLLNKGCFSLDTFFHDYRGCIFGRKMLCVAVKIGGSQLFCISQMYPSKCWCGMIHLKYIRNSWYFLWGFFIASHIGWPLGLFPSIHRPTPTPVTGPAPRSLQGIITAEVADHSLSRLGCLEPKKKVGPKTKSFLPMFSFNLFHPSHISANFAMKIF